MIKCYYVFKTYYGESGLAPIAHMSYYEWVILGFSFKTKMKKIAYQSGGGMVDAKKEMNFVSKWKHMMVH